MSNITSCFEHFIIVIEIDAIINIPNDVERSEEEYMFIARQKILMTICWVSWHIV